MTTLTPSALRPRGTENPRLTFGTALASEWRKLLTVRSTIYAALALVVLSALMVVAVTATTELDFPGAASRGNIVASSGLASGLSFCQLVMAVLAVLIVSSEYSTGLIQSTLATTPRRNLVLASKLVVSLVTAVALGLASWLVSAVIAIPVLIGKGFHVDLLDGRVLGSSLTVVVYLAIIAVFSTLLAFVIRNTAAGIGVMVAILFVIPLTSGLLPDTLQLSSFFLSSGAQQLSYVSSQAGISSADVTKGAIVTAAWLAAAGIGAALAFRRRDA